MRGIKTIIKALRGANCILLLTCEVDGLLQMHHGHVSLFSFPVVLAVDDDAIDSSGQNLGRVYSTLGVKSKNGQPQPKVHVLPVDKKHISTDGSRQEDTGEPHLSLLADR